MVAAPGSRGSAGLTATRDEGRRTKTIERAAAEKVSIVLLRVMKAVDVIGAIAGDVIGAAYEFDGVRQSQLSFGAV